MDPSTVLQAAAAAHGIQTEYFDIWGRKHNPTGAVLAAVLAAKGFDTTDIAASLARREAEAWARTAPECLVVDVQPEPADFWVQADVGAGTVRLRLALEDGGTAERTARFADLELLATAPGRERRAIALEGPLPMGYHTAEVTVDDGPAVRFNVIAAPDRVYHPPFLGERRGERGRGAGIAISLFGLRSARNWGCGDTADLKAVIDWSAEDAGTSFVALNPLHALHNRAPYNTSPYLPLCSYYRNFLYIDVEAVPEFQGSARAQRVFASEAIQQEIRRLRQSDLVEYERAHRLKLRFLKLLFREFRRGGATERWRAFEAFVEAEGELLDDFAVYCALDEWLHKRDRSLWVWNDWPAGYQEPRSEAVRAFAARHWRSVLFYKYTQFVIDEQLADCQRHALTKGLPIGLYHDLALATDRCGADLWAHRRYYARGCRVGSPPDDFALEGQDWAFPPPDTEAHRANGYRLFRESIRKNARHGGALRIDHVMRFFRLFWIPDGLKAVEGTYVRDRYIDLIRILALESHRGKFLVVGEDLGTLEPYISETLDRFGIFGYRLFYFERGAGGDLKRPHEYTRRAIVSVTTHDLPTIAGFWGASDILARRRAGLIPDEATFQAQLDQRAQDRQKMLDALHGEKLLPHWFPRAETHAPELTGELHYAIMGYLARTPSLLLVVNQEDLTKETEQQNLPGTTAEYPNWRRKMRFTVEELRGNQTLRDFTAMFRGWLVKTGRLNGAR